MRDRPMQSVLFAIVLAGVPASAVQGWELCGDVDYTITDSLVVDTEGQFEAFIRCVVAADFNNDGTPDIAASDRFDDDILIQLNDGVGGFVEGPSLHATGAQWNRIIMSDDFNGDGWPDLASSSFGGLVVFLNLGSGDSTLWLGFGPAVLYAAGEDPHWVDSADIDQDGDMDLMVADHGLPGNVGGLYYFLNQGDGTFDEGFFISLGFDARCYSIIGEDLDGDSFPEVVVVSSRIEGNLIFCFANAGLNEEDQWGGLYYDTFYPIEHGACSIRAADFNVDGHQDLVICHRTNPLMTLLYNDGTGALTLSKHVIPLSAELAEPLDADQDGLPDIGIVIKDLNQIKIFVNKGDDTFTSEETMQTGLGPKFLAVADFDLDGAPDVVTADSQPGFDWGTLTVHRNTTAFVETTCDGDISCDGKIGVDDLLGVISGWGPTPDHPGDINLDGTVGVDDLLLIISWWGLCEP
jgi:hypothetical protein